MPPKGLSRELILATAIAIVDSEGLTALTMRRLAIALGSTPMAVYKHFADKDALLDGMADQILCALDLGDSEHMDPTEAVMHLASALRDAMRDHPSVVRLFSSRVISSPGALQGGYEAPLALLRSAGFDGQTAVELYAALLTYTVGFVLYQLPRPWSAPGPDGTEERRRRRAFYESLRSDEFPNMVELAEPLASMATDEQFERGLRALLGGFIDGSSNAKVRGRRRDAVNQAGKATAKRARALPTRVAPLGHPAT